MDEKRFVKILEKIFKTKDQKGNPLNIHHFLYQKNGLRFSHNFSNKQYCDIRSISKTILAIALGVVIKKSEEGELPPINENTYIYPIIKDKITLTNLDNLSKLKKIQIKHLLTHTIGYEDILLMREDIVSINPYTLLNYAINYPIVHEPGTYYLYSNAGFYLLSVVLEEFLKEDLTNFLTRELFEPLSIYTFTWEKYGHYLAGATRLWLLPEDVAAFGELLLNGGQYNNHQLITKEWIQKMISPQIYTKEMDISSRTFRRYSYGYGIWIAKENLFFGHGTDGQILAVYPEEKTIIVTLSEQKDIKPIEDIVDQILTGKL